MILFSRVLNLFILGTLLCSTAFGGIFDVVKDVVNKVAPILHPAETIQKEIVGKAAEATGVINPEVAKQVLSPATESMKRLPDAAAHAAKTEVERFEGLVKSVKEGSIDGVIIGEIKASVDKQINPPLAEAAVPVFMLTMIPFPGHYMEEPKLVEVNSARYRGDAVVFVNGMLRDLEGATREATALSHHLKRPVKLLHNPSDGDVRDFGESIVDRFGPVFMPGKLQFNSTTKQIAHLIYHSTEPLSIVSHSQGSILVRNGLLIAERFKSVRSNVAWVSTGTPMKSEEIHPRPAKFRDIRNANDALVAQLIGLNFDRRSLSGDESLARAHGFTTAYHHQVSNNDLFGFGNEPDKEQAAIEKNWAGVWNCRGKCLISFEGDEVKLVNDKRQMVRGNLFNGNKTLRLTSGLEADLEGDKITWRRGGTWTRSEKVSEETFERRKP